MASRSTTREFRKANGLCYDCGSQRQAGIIRCKRCALKHREREALRKEGLKVEDEVMTFAEIAAEMSITRQYAQQLYWSAIRKLRRACERLGLEPGFILSRPVSMLWRAQLFAHPAHSDNARWDG